MRTWKISWVNLLTVMSGLSLTLCIAPTMRAQSSDVCAPLPAVKAALDKLPQQTPAQTDWEFHEQRAAAFQNLLNEYPHDLFVDRAYIQAMYQLHDRDKVIAEYKALYESNPSHPPAALLYGMTLVGRDSAQAIKLFNEALKANPQFPWPHAELAAIYISPAFQDKQQSTEHLKAFIDACPVSLGDYAMLARLDDKDYIRPFATQLRVRLATRTDPDAVDAYQTLWALEFKVQPASEYDALRQQVGRDLARLRSLNLDNKRGWYDTLQNGYKLVNDSRQADWAQEQAQSRFPHPWELPAETKWGKDRQWPNDETPTDKKQAFYKEYLEQSAQWVKERPNDYSIWSERLSTMVDLDSINASEVKTAANQAIHAAIINSGPDGPASYTYDDIAESLSRKHLEPEEVVDLTQKGLTKWEIESKEPPYDLASKDSLDNTKYNHLYSRLEMLGYEVDAYLQLKQADKVAPLLARTDEWLLDLKPLVADIQRHKRSFARRESIYWGEMAREAELQGRKLDAMGFYENALLTRFDAQDRPEVGKKDELADDAHRLWANLGGTEDAWKMWYGRRADAVATQAGLTWEDSTTPLPAFDLTDLSGKTWNTATLKGKVTFINFWATWCGPCRAELPHLQKLVDQYKNRTDVQFISFNIDENPGLIAPFLKEHQFAFTVIPAYTYASGTLNVWGIPTNWILDSGGVVRLKALGSDPTEKWETGVKDAIAKVENASAAISQPK